MRNFFRAAAFGLAGAVMAATAALSLEITDITGRTVVLDGPADAIVLGEGRWVGALALLDRDNPLAHVSGMLNDFPQTDAQGYARMLEDFPALADVPTFGQTEAQSVSAETIIALEPDVAVFGIEGHGPSEANAELIVGICIAGIQCNRTPEFLLGSVPVVFIEQLEYGQ